MVNPWCFSFHVDITLTYLRLRACKSYGSCRLPPSQSLQNVSQKAHSVAYQGRKTLMARRHDHKSRMFSLKVDGSMAKAWRQACRGTESGSRHDCPGVRQRRAVSACLGTRVLSTFSCGYINPLQVPVISSSFYLHLLFIINHPYQTSIFNLNQHHLSTCLTSETSSVATRLTLPTPVCFPSLQPLYLHSLNLFLRHL